VAKVASTPTCTITRRITETIVVFQDAGAGLKAIEMLATRNATASVQPFSPGTPRQRVMLRRADPSQPGSVRLRARNMGDVVKYCTFSGYVAT
jgi:hypothetical protein